MKESVAVRIVYTKDINVRRVRAATVIRAFSLNNIKILNEFFYWINRVYFAIGHGLLQSTRNVGFPKMYNTKYTRLIRLK